MHTWQRERPAASWATTPEGDWRINQRLLLKHFPLKSHARPQVDYQCIPPSHTLPLPKRNTAKGVILKEDVQRRKSMLSQAPRLLPWARLLYTEDNGAPCSAPVSWGRLLTSLSLNFNSSLVIKSLQFLGSAPNLMKFNKQWEGVQFLKDWKSQLGLRPIS